MITPLLIFSIIVLRLVQNKYIATVFFFVIVVMQLANDRHIVP